MYECRDGKVDAIVQHGVICALDFNWLIINPFACIFVYCNYLVLRRFVLFSVRTDVALWSGALASGVDTFCVMRSGCSRLTNPDVDSSSGRIAKSGGGECWRNITYLRCGVTASCRATSGVGTACAAWALWRPRATSGRCLQFTDQPITVTRR